MKRVICFGEVLWDLLPTGALPGGAPMNVAIQLRNLGIQTQIVSRVGKDDLGKRLLEILTERGVDVSLVQKDEEHATGTVHVDLSDPAEVKYTITDQVAWDFIEYATSEMEVVQGASALVYGSLASRHDLSFSTLTELLKKVSLRIFDINLRVPHYTRQRLEKLLHFSDIVKVNEEELNIISSWFGDFVGVESKMRAVHEHYDIDAICVTLGSKGAALLKDFNFYQQSGYPVKVLDTIGSGDAFLAAFIKNWLEEKTPNEILKNACALGALVATHRGANPIISAAQINELIAE